MGDGEPLVIPIDTSNWEEHINDSPRPAFVYFHGPGTEHEGPIARELRALAAKYRGIATVAAVDCLDDAIKEAICISKAAVAKVPTMRVYASQRKRNPYTHTWYKEHEEYDGLPTLKHMSMALQSQLVDDSIARIQSMRDWEDWTNDSHLPKVLVFTKKRAPSVLVRGLATHFAGRLTFAVIAPDVQQLLDEFDVAETPAVVVQRASGEAIAYTGDVDAIALHAFLSKYAPESVADEADRKNLEDTVPLFEQKPKYRNVSVAELPRLMRESEEAAVLVFVNAASLEPGATCGATLERFSALAAEIGDIFNVGLVALPPEALPACAAFMDTEALATDACHAELLIKPFGNELDVSHLLGYSGPVDAKAVQREVYEHIPEFTTHMTAQSLPGFLGLQPGGLNPFTPKVILATTRNEAPGLFRALAANFRSRDLAFGWFSRDGDPRVAEQFPVPRYPFLMVALVDPASQPDAQGQVPLGVQPFTSPLKYKFMANFVETIADRFGRGQDQGGELDDKEVFSGSTWHEAGPLPEVRDSDTLQRLCVDKGGICLLGMLDARSPGLQDDLALLELVRGTRRDQPIQFMWVDVATQPTFAAAFGVASGTAPAVVALSPRKLRYAALHGAVNQDTIKRFIDRLLAAQLGTTVLQEVPRLVEGGEAGAQDADELEAEEDEFDLSDIMAEDVGAEEDREAQLRKAMAEVEEEMAQREAEKERAQSEAKRKKKRRKSKKSKQKQSHDEL